MLGEAQLVGIIRLPGSHKTSMALYALMEHRISPVIRLIERPAINALKLSAVKYGYIQLARRRDT